MERDYSKYEPLFGAWHIVRKIGSGAGGSVYEISRTDEFGVTLRSALKAVTLPAGGEDEIKSVLFSGVPESELSDYYKKIADNVAREFRCMTQLRGNSNIVSYEDHQIIPHEDDPGWDILMRVELLTPLLDYYQGRHMEEAEILKIGADLCRALDVCSLFGILHRDIKPENIFVAPSGEYKLGDFGIAKIVESTQNYLSRKGTYTYMAPEVYQGKPYDGRADIYSLGMVLYQCLNDGRSLFMPASPAAISHEDMEMAFARRIEGQEVPLPAHGSAALRQIVKKACAYAPDDRYQTAAAMGEDLTRVMRGEGLAATKPCGTGEQDTGHPLDKERSSDSGHSLDTGRNYDTGGGFNFPRRVIAVLAALALVCAAAVYAIIPHEVESIEGLEARTEIKIGETLAPEYRVEPSRFADEPVTFVSSDPDVVSVDGEGVLTAVSVGSAVLTMTADEYSRSVEVTVTPKVTEISGIDASINLTVGNARKLSPKLTPAEYADEPVTYTVTDTDIAKVSKSGKLTARKSGNTTLTVEAGGCVLEVPVTINEPEPEIVAEPDPGYTQPAYTAPDSSSESGSDSGSKSKKKSGSSSNDRGYFDDTEKEYFD